MSNKKRWKVGDLLEYRAPTRGTREMACGVTADLSATHVRVRWEDGDVTVERRTEMRDASTDARVRYSRAMLGAI